MTPLFQPGASAAEICRSATQVGLSLSIQSALLLGAGLAIGQRLARRGPSLQSLLYRSALVAVLLTSLSSALLAGAVRPFWNVTLPPTRPPVVEPAAQNALSAPTRLGRTEKPTVLAVPALKISGSHERSIPPPRRGIEPELDSTARFYVGAVAIWGGGSVLLLGWLLFSQLWVGRLRKGCVPIRGGLAFSTLDSVCRAMRVRLPLLLAGRQVQSPFLTGIWRPAILLPDDYEAEFDAPALRAILIHEVTHLARRDCAWRLLARVLTAVLWPQPLLWLLSRRLAQVGEELCDQAVLQGEVSAHAYAACLLRLAERFVLPWPERAEGLSVVPFRSALGRRIEQILDGSRRRTLVVPRPLRGAVALGTVGAVVGGMTLVSAAAPRPSASSKAEQPMHNGEKPVGGPLTGRVVTPEGKPVGGAAISWVGRLDDRDAVLASVRTDAAGRFRFADTAPLRHRDDYPQLVVEAPGWGLAFQPVPERRAEAEIQVPPATELRVRLLDPSGQPAPHLKVVTVFVGAAMAVCGLPPGLAERFTCRTDADGAAAIAGLPQGGRLRLDVVENRFAHLMDTGIVNLQRGPVTEPLPIHLVSAGSIRGRVVHGRSGKPAGGIKVSAQGMGALLGYGDGVSDANGEYRLTQLTPGAYNVALGLTDELARSWTARAHEGVYVHSGEHRSGIDLALIPGAVIRGRVVAAETGEPLPGLAVAVYGPAHPQSSAWVQRTVAGPDGFYFHRVPEGKQHLYFQDLPPSGFLKPLKESFDLTVRDGETVTADFKLPRAGRVKPVHGRVVGPDGKPVPRAGVFAYSVGGFGGGSTPLITESDGSFVVGEKFLSQPASLRAKYNDLATPAGTTVTGGETVTLHLQPNVLASFSGRVIDPAEHPIPGAQIDLITWSFGGGRGTTVTNTDEHGRYAVAPLWPDQNYSIRVTAPGYGVADSGKLQPKPGETREMAPFVLKVADRSLAGRVVDQNGEPMVGASVRVDGKETGYQYTTADGDGRFTFAAVIDEKLTVQANFPGYRYAHKDVTAGSADLVLVLRSEEGTEKSEADPVAKEKEQFDAVRGRPAPPLHAVGWVNSAPRSMPQLRGRVVLIDFWGIGCGPCVASLPGVQRVAEEFAARGVLVIGLHNAGVSRAELAAFARKHGLTYPLAIDAADDQGPSFGKTFRQYAVHSVPSVAVIDRNGRVAYLGHSLDEAVGTLAPLLAQSRGGKAGKAG